LGAGGERNKRKHRKHDRKHDCLHNRLSPIDPKYIPLVSFRILILCEYRFNPALCVTADRTV
jgi:hypothetical protein